MLGAPCSPCCTPTQGCLDITLSGFSWTTADPAPINLGDPWLENWDDPQFNFNQKTSIYATADILDRYDAGLGLPYLSDMVLYGWINEMGNKFRTLSVLGTSRLSAGALVQFILSKYGAPPPNDSVGDPRSLLTLNFEGIRYQKQAAGYDGINPFKSPVTLTPSDVTANSNPTLLPGSITIQPSEKSSATYPTIFDNATEVNISVGSQQITLVRAGSPLVFSYTSPDYIWPYFYGTSISLSVASVSCGGYNRLQLSFSGAIDVSGTGQTQERRQASFWGDDNRYPDVKVRFLPPFWYGQGAPQGADALNPWPTLPITYYSGPSFRTAFNGVAHFYAPSVTITIDSVS